MTLRFKFLGKFSTSTALLSVALILLITTQQGHTHAVLDRRVAAPQQTIHLSIGIGHGCEGSATTEIHLSVPEGLIVTGVDQNDAFKVETQEAPFAKEWAGPQGALKKGINKIIWSKGLLEDKKRAEFGFQVYLSADLKPSQILALPVIQKCQTGETHWVEQAATDEARQALKSPAPLLYIVNEQQAHLDIRNARTRLPPPSAPVAGGYLTIRNWSDRPDRLIAATLRVADHVEIHEMVMTDGVMRMRALEKGLPVQANDITELKPGSYHLMFMKPVRPFTVGEWLEGTLTFERAGQIDVRFKVEAMGPQQPAQGHEKHAH